MRTNSHDQSKYIGTIADLSELAKRIHEKLEPRFGKKLGNYAVVVSYSDIQDFTSENNLRAALVLRDRETYFDEVPLLSGIVDFLSLRLTPDNLPLYWLIACGENENTALCNIGGDIPNLENKSPREILEKLPQQQFRIVRPSLVESIDTTSGPTSTGSHSENKSMRIAAETLLPPEGAVQRPFRLFGRFRHQPNWRPLRTDSFSQLYEALYEGKRVVLKRMSRETVNYYLNAPRIEEQTRGFRKLMIQHSPYIVRVFGVTEHEREYYCVMEYVDGDTIQQYQESHYRLSLSKKKAIAKQIILGLKHVHDSRNRHGNLQPSHIMLDKQNGEVKLISFGLACGDNSKVTIEDQERYVNTIYTAPEAKDDIHRRNEESDIYSLGVILCQLFTDDYKDNNIVAKVKSNKIAEYYPHLHEIYYSFLRNCIAHDPARRSNLEDTLQGLERAYDEKDIADRAYQFYHQKKYKEFAHLSCQAVMNGRYESSGKLYEYEDFAEDIKKTLKLGREFLDGIIESYYDNSTLENRKVIEPSLVYYYAYCHAKTRTKTINIRRQVEKWRVDAISMGFVESNDLKIKFDGVMEEFPELPAHENAPATRPSFFCCWIRRQENHADNREIECASVNNNEVR